MPIDSVLKPFVSFFLFSVFMTLNSSEIVFPSKTFFDSTSPKSSSLDFVTFLMALTKSLGVITIPGPFNGTDNGMEIKGSAPKIFKIYGIFFSIHSVS